MECVDCGIEIEYEEAKWYEGDCLCEDCYIFARGYE